MAIGQMQVEVTNLSQRGIRISADVKVTQMHSTTEGSSCSFPLTITTELLDSWGFQPDQAEDAITQLVGKLFDDGIGLLSVSVVPPTSGYWFDAYNSKQTLKETIKQFINAQDHLPFLSNPADKHQISGIFGGAILSELEHADELLFQDRGLRLLGDLDTSFDRSRAVQDLSAPPTDDKDLGHKINLLATIIDKFKVRKPGEDKGVKSIKALENWLADIVGTQEAHELVETFVRVKDLRNQYPVHDQFDKPRQPRTSVKEAEAFFEFRDIDDPTAKWKKVCDQFRSAVQQIAQVTTT